MRTRSPVRKHRPSRADRTRTHGPPSILISPSFSVARLIFMAVSLVQGGDTLCLVQVEEHGRCADPAPQPQIRPLARTGRQPTKRTGDTISWPRRGAKTGAGSRVETRWPQTGTPLSGALARSLSTTADLPRTAEAHRRSTRRRNAAMKRGSRRAPLRLRNGVVTKEGSHRSRCTALWHHGNISRQPI